MPFELGRPFGSPSDPAFQKRVIEAALRLLAHADGPVLIEDFPHDDLRAQPDPAWRPPAVPASSTTSSAAEPAQELETEIELLRGAYADWIKQHGRTTVGLSGSSMTECVCYVADWLRGKAPSSPRQRFSAPLILRFALDDLKAYCLEAATAGAAKPASRQLGDWFWNETATTRRCKRAKTSASS